MKPMAAKGFITLIFVLSLCMILASCSSSNERNALSEQELEEGIIRDSKNDKEGNTGSDSESDSESESNTEGNTESETDTESDKKSSLTKDTDTDLDTKIDQADPDTAVDRQVDPDTEFLQNLYDFTDRTATLMFHDTTMDNQIYAPLNWYLALSILGELAEGEAREEIQEVLGIPDIKYNESELNLTISTLEKRRINLGKLHFNNSLWLNDELNYSEELLTKLQSKYRTKIYKGDLNEREFQNQMTKWVSDNTNYEFEPEYHESIKTTDPYAFISLNTLNFYNEWLYPFDEENNANEPFVLRDDKEITCEFMKMEKQSYPFLIGEDYISTISILKENESMLFILPKEDLTVEDFLEEKGKLASIISDWVNNKYSMGRVKLSVPKFAYASKSNLITIAEAMGIKKIFDSNARAFSGFTDEYVYISDITQASKIEIDEKGCSASSYTEIMAMGSGVWKDEAEINLNRPFIYVLYKNKVPFLMGVVRNPLAK